MPRYQRNFNLDTSMPSTGAGQAYANLARSLESFGGTVNQVGAQLSADRARKDAGAVEPSSEAPELRSPVTVYGQHYNATVLKGHLAATQNDMQKHVSTLATQHATDPATFAASVNEIRGQYLNNVAPEVRAHAAVSFDSYAGNYLSDIQARQAQDELQASILAQTEAVGNIRANAMESLTRGNEGQFIALTDVYQQSLGNSSLPEAEKVKLLIEYKREANLAVSMGEMRASLDAGDYKSAIDHIQSVRKGNIPMVFPDTGLDGEGAADYLQEQFNKYVGDYEAQLKATNNAISLGDAEMHAIREETRNDGYELMAEGDLTMDWVRQRREELGEDYDAFLEVAVGGGGFKDVQANPAVYTDLMNRSMGGEDVKGEAERALIAGQIDKSWYDQITKQVVDRRFGGADDYISTSLKVENEFNPAAQRMGAEALAQWEQWKQEHPEASRHEALTEARAIVGDASITANSMERLSMVRPRYSVGQGSDIDINATRAATIQEYRRRLNVPDGAEPGVIRQILLNDPDFMQQSVLIDRWEALISRESEVPNG